MHKLSVIFREAVQHHKNMWRNKETLYPAIWGLVMVIVALVINNFAGQFATLSASSPVTDIILDNIPVVDVTIIFIEGSLVFWAFIAIILALEPRRFAFVAKSIALFTVIRSIFVMLTHLAPFSERLLLPPGNLLEKFTFGGDLFFSAHTGAPFLMALIFWEYPRIRYTCLLASGTFAVSVLLGHLHYSIDVFAAFFITFAIYHMAMYFFHKDFKLFKETSGKILATPIS